MRQRIAIGLVLLTGLSGCGGGGGGDSDNSSPPANYSLTATVSGLKGTAAITVNSQSPLNVAANGAATLATLTSGTAYTVTVSGQPTNQTCAVTNGTGTLNANVSNITVTCAEIVVADRGSYGKAEVAVLSIAGATLSAEQYSGVIDGNIPVTLATTGSHLSVVLPALADGSHSLQITVGAHSYTVPLSIGSPALPKPAATVTTEYLDALDASLAAEEVDATPADLPLVQEARARLAELRQQAAALSESDQEMLARFLGGAEVAIAASAGGSASPGFSKFADSTCRDVYRSLFSNGADSFAYLSYAAAAAAVGIDTGNPWAGLAGIAVAGGILKLKLLPALRALGKDINEYKSNTCGPLDTVKLELLEELNDRFPLQKVTTRSEKVAAQLTFNHKRTKTFQVTGVVRLPAELGQSVEAAGKVMNYIASFLPDTLKATLAGWTETYTTGLQAQDFTLGSISDARIAGSLTTSGEAVGLNFRFLPQQMPDAPVHFTADLTGGGGTWTIDGTLNIIDRPTAFGGSLSTEPDTAVTAQLDADFADSFRITERPLHGNVMPNETTGAFTYTPDAGYMGKDTFHFVAVNDRGDSQAALIEVEVAKLCYITDSGTEVRVNCYTDTTGEALSYQEVMTRTEVSDGWNVLSLSRTEYLGDKSFDARTASYSYTFDAQGVLLHIYKGRFTRMTVPTLDFATPHQETGSVDYSTTVPGRIDQLTLDSTTRDFVTLEATSSSIVCWGPDTGWLPNGYESTEWFWIIDPYTGLEASNPHVTSSETNPGCPISVSDVDALLPLKPQDMKAYKIWYSVPRP